MSNEVQTKSSSETNQVVKKARKERADKGVKRGARKVKSEGTV